MDDQGFYYFDARSEAPSDWLSPNDYYNGEWHARYEIYDDKGRIYELQNCIWQDSYYDDGIEICSARREIGGTGVYDIYSTPNSWWKKK